MNIQKPSGIIFDLGDTVIKGKLMNTRAGNERLLELAEDTNGVTPEDINRLVLEMQAWFDAGRESGMLEVSFQSMQRLIFSILGVRFKVDYRELERGFWQAAAHYEPMPGIYDILDTLDSLGIPTGVLSNSIISGQTLVEELAQHNLAHRFAFLISSADYAARKPHRFIFQAAVREIGLEPGKVWFIGDKPRYDVRGALDAGLFPVWLNWRQEPRVIEGDYLEVASLDELREAIASLMSKGDPA